MGFWSQMTSPAQDGSDHIRDILASFLYSGRKWGHVVHLYIQSMVPPFPSLYIHIYIFEYSQGFSYYSLTWSGMTSILWWLMLANVSKLQIDRSVCLLYDTFSITNEYFVTQVKQENIAGDVFVVSPLWSQSTCCQSCNCHLWMLELLPPLSLSFT